MATQPTKWYIQIGVNSEKAKIPINAGADQIDLSKLYPSAYELPLDAGGQAVGRKEMNALFSTLAENIYFQQRGGVYSYDSTIDYTVGTLVLYNSNLYKCIQAHSHTTPRAPTNTSYWQKIVIQSDIANFVTLNTAQTISAIKNFSALPTTSVPPTGSTQLTNKSYVDTKVSLSGNQTVAGTKTFSSSPLIPTATAGDSSAKGASTAFVQNAIAQLVPTGTILAFGGVTAPNGFLICNGSAISRTTYANLFAVIGTRYGAGNGSTTFNLPKLNDGSFVRGVDSGSVGTKYSASLPPLTATSAGAHTHTRGTMEITGRAQFDGSANGGYSASGALKSSGDNGIIGTGGGPGDDYNIVVSLKASDGWTGATSSNGAHTHTVTNSVGVAMNGNTVLPQSVGVNYIIKI
jgi:microcystin-dependent protein